MKKKFTLITVFLALVSSIHAQAILLHQGFDAMYIPSGWSQVDADGDGHSWMPFLTSHGARAYAGAGCITSESYDNDNLEYLYPDNWLISPAITINTPAVAAYLTFYVRGQDNSTNFSKENYGVYVSTTGMDLTDFDSVFYATSTNNYEQQTIDLTPYIGQTIRIAFRHYNTAGMFMLNIDEVEIKKYTTSSIEVTPTAIDFGTVYLNNMSVKPATVSGHFTTDAITASVPSGTAFSISADNAIFADTATLSATGGTLYIKYEPTVEGIDNRQITLTSTGATDKTISLSGIAYNCVPIVDFPYTESFEDSEIPLCWTTIDADGDGYCYFIDPSISEYAHTGSGFITSLSFNENSYLTPDDWLITPPVTLGTSHAELSFWIADFETSENYGVYISTTLNNDTNYFTPVHTGSTTTDYAKHVIDLDGYANETVYIAFRHTGGSSGVRLDDIRIEQYAGPTIEVTPTALNFEVELDDDFVKQAGVLGHLTTADITAVVPPETDFSISADNITFADTVILPNTGGTLYVKYAPGAAGDNNCLITLTSTGATDAFISLAGKCMDCSSPIADFPYMQGFDDGVLPPCWTILDADNDGHSFMIFGEELATFALNGQGGFAASASYDTPTDMPLTPDNWLITPPIALDSTPIRLCFWISAQDPDFPDEKYGVYISQTHDSINTDDFTPLLESTATGEWVKHTVSLEDYANQTVYIAFRHYNTTDQYWLKLDDVSLEEIEKPNVFVDYSLDCFCDANGNPLTVINLSPDDGFRPNVLLTNHGPDVPNPADSIYIEMTLENEYLGEFFYMGDTFAEVTAGVQHTLYLPYDLLAASDMDQLGLENFEFCYTVRIAGMAIDPVEENNRLCINVTRGADAIAHIAVNPFYLYPNPANNVLNITTNTNYERIEIVNYIGQTVYADKISAPNIRIGIAQLETGIYIVRLTGKDGVISKKFIKK